MKTCVSHTMRLAIAVVALSAAGCGGPPAEADSHGTKIAQARTVDTDLPSNTAPHRETLERPVTLSAPKATLSTSKRSLGTLPPGIGIPTGERAPDFTALDTSRKPVSLSDLVHKSKVLLFFYRGGW